MKSEDEIKNKVFQLLSDFYRRRIDKITTLKLKDTLTRKNPYLYKAIGIQQASEIVKEILIAYMSSSDEGIFGDAFFEPLAEFISDGHVSDAEGVDIVLENDTKYKAFAIKSGPSVFNADSRKKQSDNFLSLGKRVAKRGKAFDAIVGYGYGQKYSFGGNSNFREIGGQCLWEEISGDPDFYLKVIKLMDNAYEEHLGEYNAALAIALENFTIEFEKDFCCENGEINWNKLLKFNSGKRCTKLSVLPKSKSLTFGEELQLSISAIFYDGEINVLDKDPNEIYYEMSNNEIFKINDGLITVKPGAQQGTEVSLTVRYLDKHRIIKLKVKKEKVKKDKK